MSQVTGGVEGDMKAWFRSVDLSQMGVIDRMVFDINRRAILEKSRSKPVLEKTIVPDSDYVFQRLLEDTHKRVETKKKVEEFHREQEKRPKTPKVREATTTQAVYNRLQEDARARKESSVTRMRIREAEERLKVQEMRRVKSPGSVDKTQLVKRLTIDAEQRKRKAEEMRKEKEKKEAEEAHRLACLHHPKRKLDPNVMLRLTKVHRRQATFADQSSAKPPLKTDSKLGNRGKATPGLKRISITRGGKKEYDVDDMLRKAETQVRKEAKTSHSPSFSFDRNSSVECLPMEIEEPEWVQVSEHKESRSIWKEGPVVFKAEEATVQTPPSHTVKVPRLKLSEMKEELSGKKVDLIARVLGKGNGKVNLS